MPDMASTPTAPTDAEHEAEAAKQAEIAAAVEPQAPVVDETSAPEAPIVEEPDPVKLRSKNVDEYPLSVSVVGVEDELVFESASSTVEVSPEVAEQITYSPVVEVAE